jgi:hypothetical protein
MTQEFLSLQRGEEVSLPEHPDQYRPMFKPHREGGVDTCSGGLGFTGIELDPKLEKGDGSATTIGMVGCTAVLEIAIR